jgi:hypothetical protein
MWYSWAVEHEKGMVNDMATISAYDSSSISVLFSSLTTNKTSSVSSVSNDLLGISYSDYASIKNGSYHKLLSAYYSTDSSSSELKSVVSNSTSTSKDSSKTLTSIQSDAESLASSADTLLATGKSDIFAETTKTAEDGTTTTGYDTDAIYSAVNKFVSDYNSLIDSAADSNTTSILRAAKNMVNYSSVNSNALSKIGITIGTDNKLTLDKDTFEKADMSKVKSLFRDSGSYGYQIKAQATLMNTYVDSEKTKNNTYSSSGTYTYNYTTGEIYNSAV